MRFLSLLASLFLAFLLFMTGARFILLLLNADKTNQIVHWILSHSDFWVKPFANLFHIGNHAIGSSGGIIEPASLIAFVVYAVVGGLILSLLKRASFGDGFGRGGILRRT
jgi:hypothetical protein